MILNRDWALRWLSLGFALGAGYLSFNTPRLAALAFAIAVAVEFCRADYWEEL